MDLLELRERLQNIDVWEILIPVLDKHLQDVEHLNKEQLKAGKTADGTDTPSHSRSLRSQIYVEQKADRGVYNPEIYPSVNLYNTGAFYRGFKAKLDMFYGIELESSDFKAKALEEHYGTNIYGLNDISLEKFTDLIFDEFIDALYNYILA